jgi:TorA maturation chaperone TorD
MLSATFALEDTATTDTKPDEPDFDPQAVRAECLARADIYRILGGVFVEEPSCDFLASLRAPAFLEAIDEVGIVFKADFLESDLPALSDALACEYATLFASSGGFPPIESVRLTGRFKQDPHFQVQQIYKRMGFEQVTGRFEVFPDQLGIELMFVGALLQRCAVALERDDLLAYKKLEKEIKRFWTLHLGRWVRGYSGLIERAANHSFYRQMARFLGGFAAEEIAAMGLTHLDDLDQGQLEVPKSEIKMEFNPDDPVCGECAPSMQDRSGGPESARVIPIKPLHDLSL